MQTPTILVGDKDEAFLAELAKETGRVKILTASDEKKLRLAIADHQTRYSAICINVNLTDPASLPLIRFSKTHRPSTPLYLLSDNATPPFTAEETASLHIQSILFKPIEPGELVNSIFPGAFFDVTAALDLAKEDKTQAGEETDVDEEGMHAIDALAFIGGKTSFFDLYVRLKKDRFVMILKAGDPLDHARLASYLAKGVKFFYIKKEAQQFYLQYCDKLTQAILESNRLSLKQKTAQVTNLGRETMEYLKSAGLSELTLQSASRFVSHANNLIRRSDLGQSSTVKAFLADVILADHGTSTAMLVSMIVQAMKFEDEKTINAIAMAAMLHDIGLAQLPEKFKTEQEHTFLPEEKTLFETHPALGAEIIRKVPQVNPLLPQVIEQHHERRDRRGFPLKLGAGAISPVAEVVGIADVFLNLLVEAKDTKSGITDPVEEMRLKHMNGFSAAVADAFLKAMKN